MDGVALLPEWTLQPIFTTRNAQGLRPQARRFSLKRGNGAQKALFFTVDVYPEFRPSHPSRYYGTWQFPIEVSGDSLDISVERVGEEWKLRIGEEPIAPSNVLQGKMRENGVCRIYAVVAERDTFRELARAEFCEEISFDGAAVDTLLHWPGRRQRTPVISDAAYLSLKTISRMLRDFSADAGLSENSRLLDVGCAHKPYYPFFAQSGCEYVGVDIFDGQFVDKIWLPGERLPFDDATFDAAISTQVLEHTSDPAAIVAETHRVLKPGGSVFFSVPFAWEEHDYPSDFWRFAERGLRRIFDDFNEVDVRPVGNSRRCLVELRNLLEHRCRKPGRYLDYRTALRNRLAERFGKNAKTAQDFALPSNYAVIAKK